jgi:hypothetical protein
MCCGCVIRAPVSQLLLNWFEDVQSVLDNQDSADLPLTNSGGDGALEKNVAGFGNNLNALVNHCSE